jgi:hypothetical protein
MSSSAVRTKFETFMATENPTEKFAVLDGGFEDIQDFLLGQTPSIDPGGPWTGIQYSPNDEVPITAASTNISGKYRETGLVFIHVVDIAKLTASAGIITRCEAMRNKLRGQNILGLRVLSVSPQNFSEGATLDFEGGGYISATFTVEFELDINI